MSAAVDDGDQLWDDKTPAGAVPHLFVSGMPCAACQQGSLYLLEQGCRPRRVDCPACHGTGWVRRKIATQGASEGRAADDAARPATGVGTGGRE